MQWTPPSIGELKSSFPDFILFAFLAKGGMGAVYLAEDKASGQKCAIKLLAPDLSKDQEFLVRFKQEADTMGRLEHNNLISFYQFFQVDGYHCIIMEYVDGKSLHYSAHKQALDQKAALVIILGLCRGVQHAHKLGILHRDIKPDNILLTSDATPKLGDFGLSRPLAFDEEQQVIYATKGYSAPEVYESPELVDERADIFSIGVILYEMLVGHLPEKEYLPASGYFPEIDPWFDIIILRSIDPDPDLRYPSIKAMLADLCRVKYPELRYKPMTAENLERITAARAVTKTDKMKLKKPKASFFKPKKGFRFGRK